MKNFNIEITKFDNNLGQGKITLDDYYELFFMAFKTWKKEDYLTQWNVAKELVKNNKNACFISNIEHKLIEMWAFYAINQNIYVQNYLFVEVEYKKLLGSKKITPINACDFIPERKALTEEGFEISEWVLKR